MLIRYSFRSLALAVNFKGLKRFIKIAAITALILALCFGGILFYFSKNIVPILKNEIAKVLAVDVDVADIKVSKFLDFPNVGITLTQVKIDESTPYFKSYLLEAEELSLYVNIKKLYKGVYEIDKIKLKGATVRAADLAKTTNYEIIKPEESTEEKSPLSFEIKRLELTDCDIKYNHVTSEFQSSSSVSEALLKLRTNNDIISLALDGILNESVISVAKEKYINQKDLDIDGTFDINTSQESVVFGTSKIKINDVPLVLEGEVNYGDKSDMNISFKSNNTSCQSLLSVLPASISESANHLNISGDIAINGSMSGKYSGNNSPSLQIDYRLDNTAIKAGKGIGISGISGNGKLSMPSMASLSKAGASIKLEQAKQDQNQLKGFLKIVNFNRPTIHWDGNIKLNLPSLLDLANMQDVSDAKGNISLDGKISATIDANGNGLVPGSLKIDGKLLGKGLTAKFTNPNIDLKNLDVEMAADETRLAIRHAKFQYNEAKGELNAVVQNYDQLGSKNSESELVGDLFIDGFNVNDFYTEASESTTGEGGDLIPIKLRLKSVLANFKYNDFTAKNISGILQSNRNDIFMKQCNIDALDGKTKADVSLKNMGKEAFLLDINSKLSNVSITKLFKQFNNFEQTEITHEHLSGNLNGNIIAKVILDKNYEPILPKLYAKAKITISNGELNNYGPMSELSSFVSIDDLNNIKFESLSNTIEIFNEKIYIPKMLIKNNAINLELEGSHTFENYMDYSMSLSVVELLATKANWLAKKKEKRIEQNKTGGLTAYITMKGTPDDLEIKYDKAAAKEKMKEEIKKEKKTFIKAIKGEASLKDEEPEKDYDDVWDE